MARTPEGAALTEAHRQLQALIATATTATLLQLWRVVDVTDLRGTLSPFLSAGKVIVQGGRRQSSAAARGYYVAFRRVEGIRGTAEVVMAPPPPEHVVSGALVGAGVVGIKNARSRGQSIDEAHSNGAVKMVGSATSLVAGGGRATLLDAISNDPAARGYQRVTDGAPCAFCSMIASRGIVAYSADSAGFEAHDHCGCTAEPAFEGSQVSPTNARLRDAWDTATSGLKGTDALNAFRAHLAGT